jgi:formylglycine-generating enzyme required for sulfatase activity
MSLLTEIRLRLPRVTLVWRNGPQTAELLAGGAVELPLADGRAATLDVIGDLGNAEVVLTPHPPWADRFWRDSSGLWVETTVRGGEWKVEEGKRSLFGAPKPKLTIVPQDLTTRLLWPTWAKALARDEHGVFAEVELADKVVTRLRWIPPGRFLMGSPKDEKGRVDAEGPQHWVTLSKGYWLADAPCTQAEWRALMGTEPSHFKGENLPEDERARLPVEQVSWDDCQEFCERLQARFPGMEARLPSEAEWEYACRAGTASAFNDGSACTEPQGNDPALAKLGWFDENSDRRTQPVRKLKSNQWGLCDMHGNVWEWCGDSLGAYAADEQQDPTGAESGRERVCRGGSWVNVAWGCRSAYRLGGQPDGRFVYLGFRLASGQSGQNSNPSEERADGKQAGRRPAAPGGERAAKQAKVRK